MPPRVSAGARAAPASVGAVAGAVGTSPRRPGAWAPVSAWAPGAPSCGADGGGGDGGGDDGGVVFGG